MLKKLFGFVIGLISLFSIVGAQNSCEQERFQIKGDNAITINQVSEYTILDNWGVIKSSDIKSSYVLWKDSQRLESAQGDKFFFNFENEGEHYLIANFTIEECKYELEKKIDVFYKSIIYIGYDLEEFKIGYENNFKSNAILFSKILISNNVFSEDDIKSKLLEKQNEIKNADIIVINNKETDSIFQVISKLSQSENINLSNKEIFVINNLNKHFMKRTLSKYISLIDNKSTYIVNNIHLLSLLSDLSFGRDIIKESLLEVFPLYFEKRSNWMVLSYLTDHLIVNGLPINLIGLLLTLTLATLVITVFRQVIGFGVFGTFSPLLFGLSILVLGTQTSVIFFIIAFIATLLTRLITKGFYLLHSAKVSLLITIYLLTILVVLGLDKVLGINIVDFNVFSNVFSIFPIIFLILVTDKVFHEGFKIFSKGWLVSLIEFIIVSFLVFLIISSVWIRLILLSYPEIIILVGIMIMIVGRFTGLQMLEYFRFMPLLKGEGEEE